MKLKNYLLSLLVLFVYGINAQTLTHTFSFDNPKFIEKYDGYVEPQVKNCLVQGREGQPLLPSFSTEILLPQGTQIQSIQVKSVTWKAESKNIKIVPASRQFPISKPAPENYRPVPDMDVYNADNAFPGNTIATKNTQFLGGYSIAVIGINPMEYFPAQNLVKCIDEITIEIETEPIARADIRSGHANLLTEQRVANLVENPEMMAAYSFAPTRDEAVDILLITKESFVDVFQTYITYKTERGFAIQVETVENIYDTYPGDDDQEMIRNCIIDYYENHGLTYVILGGDADPNNSTSRIIPHRGFYASTDSDATVDTDLPSDMYYCCLDGNWNTNNNDLWGEPGEEDIYAEVMIGRMCVDSETEISNMTSKLIKYQETPVVNDIEKSLMVGEALDDQTWGGDSKDEVANGSSNFGLTTVGLSDNFSINTLYERTTNWSKNDVFNEFNNVGCHLLNHLGHSSTGYNMKIYNSDITVSNFQNDGISRGFVIGYSQGCYNGAFDNRGTGSGYSSDCFSENITVLATGEVATLGNSRYGWYSPGNTNGASQYLDREFYDAIFGEGMTQIGVANSDSREDNAARILSSGVIRWCAYEITLFGDPTMDIWTAQPTTISANHPNALPIGSGEINITTDAPYARVGLMQNGILIGRGVADEAGDVDVDFFSPLASAELIDIFITAHNKTTYTDNIAVVTDQPYVIFDAIEINDAAGNNNGEVDFGETIQLSLSLENVGNQAAAGVNVTLASTDPYISIPYLVVDFGDFDPGEVITIEEAFEVIIADDIPDQHTLEIEVNAVGQETWNSDFEMVVCAPALNFTNVTIDDMDGGNGNNMLDPGETAILKFDLMNQGHCLSPEIMMELEALNEFITVVTGSLDCPALNINETGTMAFEVLISEDAASGDVAKILADAEAGAYQLSRNYTFDVGLVSESFETGDFSAHDWDFSGNADWEICTDDPWEGDFCIRSGAIGNNADSEISLDIMTLQADTISFYRKVSSESNYDYLSFYVDNSLMGQWSGEEAWQLVEYVVPAGMHTLRWVYEKDQGVQNGDDCGWIDFILFPPLAQATINAGDDGNICQGETFVPDASAYFVQGINWSTNGDGEFNNTNMMKPTYTPGSEDIQNGEVMLSVTANGTSGGTVGDDVMLYIHQYPQAPPMPEGDINPCTNYGLTYEYTISGVNEEDEFFWELLPEEAGTIEGNSTTGTITWTPDYVGMVELHVSTVNACGQSAFSEALEIAADICTGTDEINKIHFDIYPNPNHGQFIISIPEGAENAELKVYNAFGKVIVNQSAHTETMIDLSAYTKGIYFIHIQSNQKTFVEKVVVE